MAQRRAVTLLELLIAIGLVVALAAIVAPSLVTQLEERRFDSAVDVVAQHLMLARAHAQSTGRPVEVRWVAGGRASAPSPSSTAQEAGAAAGAWRLQARLLKLELPDEVLTDADATTIGPDSTEEDEETPIYEPWALQQLPGGCTIVDAQPQWLQESVAASAGAFDAAAHDTAAPAAAPPEDDAPIRVAVFLPDGSALVAQTRWLVDDAQRAARIEVNAWTGLPTVQRVEQRDHAPAAEDADETDGGDAADDEPERFEDVPASARDRAADRSAAGDAGADDDATRRSAGGEADEDGANEDGQSP